MTELAQSPVAADATDIAGDADLIVVGAGAKAAAIAAKVHVLNSLGRGPIALTIVEATEPAASWSGRNGMTSGEEPLAITPIKDVGFPYQSFEAFGDLGEQVDRAMLPFSWQQYMIDRHAYARWVNAGSPSIQHRGYGQYLTWVLSRATEGVRILRGRVARVFLEDRRWAIDVDEGETGGCARHTCGALVLTGPGIHRPLPHDPAVAARIFHCDSRRIELARIPVDEAADIAIIGGGESALSSAAFLRAFRPDANLTIYTPNLPLSRGESFLENRVFSDPDEVSWSELDPDTRRDFVRHCDRGVFDPGTLAAIAYDEHFRFLTGRVRNVAPPRPGRGVRVDYLAPGGPASGDHDFVINCTGFDLLEQLRCLFPSAVREEIERRVGGLWERPAGVEVPIGRFLELQDLSPRLHIPGLAGVSQGPGFANLGCLGLLANRVLEPLHRELVDGRHHTSETNHSFT
jgi:mycobactin lysine-N-oxygenase